MSDKNQVTYAEVSNVANILIRKGKKITLENIRRELGKGTHSEIAVILGKWNKEVKYKPKNEYGIVTLKEKNHGSKYSVSKNRESRNDHVKRKNNVRKNIPFNLKENGYKKRSSENPFFIRKKDEVDVQILSNRHIIDKSKISIERLLEESTIVQKIFLAAVMVKKEKLNVAAEHQKFRNIILQNQMQKEETIRIFKEKHNIEINRILDEWNSIKLDFERKIIAFRNSLSL